MVFHSIQVQKPRSCPFVLCCTSLSRVNLANSLAPAAVPTPQPPPAPWEVVRLGMWDLSNLTNGSTYKLCTVAWF